MTAGALQMDEDLVLAQCASEPIRTPGAIQPHGYLLAFDTRRLVLQHASANVATLVARDLCEILGRRLSEWPDAAEAATVVKVLEVTDLPDSDAPPSLKSTELPELIAFASRRRRQWTRRVAPGHETVRN
jgi:light-regulated signal transduction histidine kinase (bacteriophytochrome)